MAEEDVCSEVDIFYKVLEFTADGTQRRFVNNEGSDFEQMSYVVTGKSPESVPILCSSESRAPPRPPAGRALIAARS